MDESETEVGQNIVADISAAINDTETEVGQKTVAAMDEAETEVGHKIEHCP